jgi:hypothetical protein
MDIRKELSVLVARLRGFPVSDDIVIRLRWFLLFMGILAVYIGLQMGDDWYVKESATYDWARGLGY